MTILVAACLFCAVALLLCACATDLVFRTIPNWIPLALCCDGAVLQAARFTLVSALLPALAVFGVCAVLWRMGVMGGGDVKLFGAAALAVPATAPFVAATALAGGVLAVLYAAARPLVRGWSAGPAARRSLLRRVLRIERRRVAAGSLPYGCAIAAGALLTLAGG